jgi:Tol biopolymer transport system component
MFWPDADYSHARGSLNRAVYFLRQQLGPELIVTHGDEEVGVAADRLRWDVGEFESALVSAPERALELYRGDLAPGLLVGEAPGFESWLDLERDRLRARAAEAALRLAGHETGPGGLARAERWAERAMGLAPYDERAVRIRMTLLDRVGERALSLRVFEEFERRLLTELEVAPSPETIRLADSIRSRAEPRLLTVTPQPVAPATPAAPSAPAPQAHATPAAAPRRWRALVPLGAGILALAGWLMAGSARHWAPPLPTGHWAQVTSEEGIDFEPALSPGGSEVAYATRRGGRLVIAVRSATGTGASGELLLAPRVAGDQALPVWSSDGELIRFTTIAENQPAVWWEVGRLGGTPRQLSVPRAGRWAAWTGDGARIAMVANDSFFVTSRDEPGVRALPFSAGITMPHSLAWSPDEHWIAFVDMNVLWPIGRNTSGSTLCLISPVTGWVVRVTDDRQLNVSPAWVDSRTLLFVSDRDGVREVYAIQIGPEGPLGEPRKLPGGTGVHSISVSADRSRLALSRMEARTELRRFSLRGGPPPGLSTGQVLLNGNQVVESHDVSPDGHWLLFDSNRRGAADLFKLELDAGAGPTPLFTGPSDQFFPQWSPDGREVVYYGGPGPMALWLMPAGGGTPTRLSDSTEVVSNPRWSPDGLSVAYTSEADHRGDVWIRSRRDHGSGWGPAQRLTDFGCYLAAWAPSGDGVICRSANGREILLVSRDGRVRWRRNLTALGFARNSMVISAAGDSNLYFVGKRGAEEGIWAWPLRGGEPRLVLRADDPGLDLLGYPGTLTVTHDQLVTTIGRMESDIWITELQ